MKRYILLILIITLLMSSLVAMATARNDIWKTAVPMSSSPAVSTTFKSTSSYNNRATSYGLNPAQRSTSAYRNQSSTSYRTYQSSSATTRSYGANGYSNVSIGSAYRGSNNSHNYNHGTLFPIASSGISSATMAGITNSSTTLSSNKYSWRGTFPANPGLGDEWTENGVSYTWNGEEWILSADEPAPIGDIPIIMIVILISIVVFHRKRLFFYSCPTNMGFPVGNIY